MKSINLENINRLRVHSSLLTGNECKLLTFVLSQRVLTGERGEKNNGKINSKHDTKHC